MPTSGPTSSANTQHVTAHLTCHATGLITSHTRYNSYAPVLYEEAEKKKDVVDFFETVIMYYMRLPTYDWLAKKGITPSNTTTYTLSDMQNALTAEFGTSDHSKQSCQSDQRSGATPYIGCTGPRYNATAAGKGSMDSGRTIVDEGLWPPTLRNPSLTSSQSGTTNM